MHAEPGALDVTFNNTGVVRTDIGGSHDEAYDMVVQSDGKILLTGFSFFGIGQDIAVVRYNADGSLDASFGNDGIVTTSIGFGSGADLASAIALQSDGKIIVAGQSDSGGDLDFVIVRYEADGRLDRSFNGSGIVTTDIGFDNDTALDVIAQSDGKIVAVGQSVIQGQGVFAVVRYNPDGSLDTGFNGTGKVITAIGDSNDLANSVALQSDGKIVVTGSSSNGSDYDVAIVRYNTDGSLDTTFNGIGAVWRDFGLGNDFGFKVVIGPDGRILVAGAAFNGSDSDFALLRYNADGSADNTLNGAGTVRTAIGVGQDLAYSMALQSDGRIVVAGISGNTGGNYDFATVRYNADGSLDSSFKGFGIVTTALGSNDDLGSAVAVQGDGKIVVAGSASNGADNDFAVVRYQNASATNDNFVDAQALNGANGAIIGDNRQATFELAEPDHLGSGSHSVWYQWTVPTTGPAVVDLFGSDFDTVLAVYSGNLLDGLTLVAANDDSSEGFTSRLTFAATAGTTYRIAVDGFGFDTGDIFLSYQAGARVEAPTTNEPGTLTDTGFTIQTLTPSFSWNAVPGATRYGIFISKAPYGITDFVYSNTSLTGTTFLIPAGILVDGTKYRWNMTSFDATGTESLGGSLLLYFETNTLGPGGFSLSSDPPVWDASAPAGPAVRLHWTASINATVYDLYRDGVLYQVGLNALNFYDRTALNSGGFYSYVVVARNAAGFRVSEEVEVGPMPFAPIPGTNDSFANAQPLSGANGFVFGRNSQATLEPGEPNHLGGGSRSVWYRWIVPSSGAVVVDLAGSNFDTLLAIYTGTSLNGLTLVAENDDSEDGFNSRVTFGAVAGTTYWIAVDGFDFATGDIVLTYAAGVGPTAATGAPAGITSNSVTMTGTVNPNGMPTTAFFEYGLTTAYGGSTSEQTLGNERSEVVLSQLLSGLEAGATYHYRLVASSGAASVAGADVSFTTPSLTSTTLRFSNASYSTNENGSVVVTVIKSGGLPTEVRISTTDGVATADDYTALTQTVQFAAQETAKQITIAVTDDTRAEPDEEFTVSLSNATNGATILAGTATVTIVDNDTAAKPPQFLPPDPPPSATGALEVNLINSPQGGRWRLQGETTWRQSGPAGTVSALTEGEYVAEFEPQGGPVPPPQTIVITAQGKQTITVDYAAAVPSGSGTLTVNLEPPEVADPALVVAPELRARWRFLGENDSAWRNTGVKLEDLRAGTYVLEFSAVAGRARVPNLSIFIEPTVSRTVTALYQRTTNPVGAPPQSLTLLEATTQEPFVNCGQVQTDTGFGSGIVVKERVVLTAGHVVFNDAELTFGTTPVTDSSLSDFAATGIRWRFERMQRELEPVPLVARGTYVLSGYANARRAKQTQQARERDAAALYFFERAGRGGFAEPLVTDAANEWLLKPRNKSLVGYPIDDERIAEGDRGRLHAVPKPPGPVSFLKTSSAFVYRTNAIHGLPGCSGGPLCVEGDDGHFYPAGIYLGGNEEALVRAIDSEIVSLIALAVRSSGDGGENHTNGGIVRVESQHSVASFTLGRLRVNLGPSAAVAAGAKWRLATENDSALRNSGGQASMPLGRYTVVFNDVPGFVKPADINFNLQDDRGAVLQATYQPAAVPRITSAAAQSGKRKEPFAYQIETNTLVDSFAITGALPPGLALNGETGRISGTPAQSGRFPVTVQVGNSAGNDALALVISIAPVLLNQVATGSVGRDLNYQLTTADVVSSYAADQLTALGLILNVNSGVISGAPNQAGTFNIPISISNDGGTATALLALTVRATNDLSGLVGRSFTPFQVPFRDAVSIFSANNLPPGLTIDRQSGVISGAPTVSGSFLATIQVTDDDGSSTIQLPFVIDAVLHVTVSSGGQITGGFAGDSFQTAGQPLSITAVPQRRHFFAGWTGGEASREPTLNFTMRDGLTLQATFVPFASVKGRYRGVLTPTPGSSGEGGSLSVELLRNGTLTGSIKLFNGKKSKIQGVFDESGRLTLVRKRKPIEGQLQIDGVDGPPRISGQLVVSGTTLGFTADRKTSGGRTTRAGRYTLALSNEATREEGAPFRSGDGFAVLVVSAMGSARLAGTLDDGTHFAAGLDLTDDDTLPLHTLLGGMGGALTGVLTFENDQPGASLRGTLQRVTPNGASESVIYARGSN